LLKEKILKVPGVTGVHDIHTWTLDGEYNILTIHLVLKKFTGIQEIKNIKDRVKDVLNHLKMNHVTIETEFEEECCDEEDSICPGDSQNGRSQKRLA
jgi:cobalt-zinc-cadmium efflux system protein